MQPARSCTGGEVAGGGTCELAPSSMRLRTCKLENWPCSAFSVLSSSADQPDKSAPCRGDAAAPLAEPVGPLGPLAGWLGDEMPHA